MPGLLGDVLPWVYSRADAAKRALGGLLADPVGSAQQTMGLLNDKARDYEALQAQAFADPKRPFRVTDRNALGTLADQTLAGPLGFAPVGIFAGVGAKTADKAALATAQKLERQGVAPDAIWQQTGWGKAPDGKWRFEIDDSTAKNLFTAPDIKRLRDINGGEWIGHSAFMKKYPGTDEALTLRLANTMRSDYLSSETPTLGQSFSHQKLMDAYPDLYKTRTVIKNDMPIGEGGYAEAHDALVLSPMDGKLADNVMLHELQHAIQQREGFAGGGTPDLMVPMLEESIARKTAQARSMFDASRRNDPLSREVEILKPGMNQRAMELQRQAQDMQATLGRINEFGDGFADDAYRRLAGEAEARLVQSRMNLTPAQRAAQYPWEPGYFQGAAGVPVNALLFR